MTDTRKPSDVPKGDEDEVVEPKKCKGACGESCPKAPGNRELIQVIGLQTGGEIDLALLAAKEAGMKPCKGCMAFALSDLDSNDDKPDE